MLFIFLVYMLTDRQTLVVWFWRVIILLNVPQVTYSLAPTLSLPTTRFWLSQKLFFVITLNIQIVFYLSVATLLS